MDNQTWHRNGWLQEKLPKFGFGTHTTSLWPMKQSSSLIIHWPARSFPLTAAHARETGCQN